MKSKNKITVILIFVVVIASLLAGTVYAVSPEQQAIAFANEQFNKEWRGTCIEVWNTIGFNTPEEAENSYLGEPVQLLQLKEEAFSAVESMMSQTSLTPYYLFPVMADGRYVTDFEVRLKNGEWVAGRLGGDMVEFLQRVAQANNLNVSDCRLIRFGPKTAIFVIKDGKEVGLAYPNDAQDPVMSEEGLAAFKKTITDFFERPRNTSSNEVIVYGGNSPSKGGEYSFHQDDSLLERVSMYLDYFFGSR